MASSSNSGSSSTTWEGIEGYVPQFVNGKDLDWTQNTVNQKKINQMTGKELEALYGFLSGSEIDKRYQDAANAKYNELDETARKARDTSMNDMAVGMDSYLGALREQRAKAPQTGITRGANAASEITGLMNNQKLMSESQQAYADNLNKIGLERGTAAYEAKVNALKERNSVANQLGTLGMQKYGFDVQDNASYYSYLGQMGANKAATNQAAAAWNATEGQNTRRKTSESSSWSSSYDDSADVAAAAQRYAVDSQGSSNREAFDGAMQAAMNQGLSKDQAYLYAMGLDYTGLPGKQDTGADIVGGAAPYGNGTKPAKSPGTTGTYDSYGNWNDTKHPIYGGR